MAFDPDAYLKGQNAAAGGFDPDAYLSHQSEPGLLKKAGQKVLEGVAYVGEKFDQYGGAPTRAAISSLQDDMFEPGRAVEAFKNQFGEDPKTAPTGRDIVRRAGVPDTALSEVVPNLYSETGDEWLKLKRGGALDPTASGVAGVAMEVAADPMTVLPVGAAAKAVSGAAVKSAAKVGKVAAKTGEVTSKAGTKAVTKVGSLFTGVPEKEIATYIKQYPEVQKLIREHGDDLSSVADDIREGFQGSIRAKRQALGAEVGRALDALPNEKVVDVNPVLAELEKVKGRMNQTLRFEEVKQVDELANRIRTLAGDGGKVTPREMFDIKEFLQDRGAGAFMKDGQIFVPGKDAQIAAKQGSRVAREIVNTMSPNVANANKELSRLHVIEKRLNKNLISPGKSEAALATAGSGVNPKNAKELELLGQITGSNMVGEAEKFAAARRFSNPGFSAADTTGKAVERMGKAGLIGMGFGGIPGAAVAAFATSPLALKTAIQAGRIPVKAIEGLVGVTGKLTDATIDRAYRILQTKEGQKALEGFLQGAKVHSIGELRPMVAEDQNRGTASVPKGESKWAQDGARKLGITDSSQIEKLMKSKEGKRLLIEASDLSPDSKGLQRIKKQIEKGWQAK